MLPAIYAWLAKAAHGDHRVLGCLTLASPILYRHMYLIVCSIWVPRAGKMFSTTYVYIVLVQKAIARLTRLVAIGAALIG
jgi:hypothetical protein